MTKGAQLQTKEAFLYGRFETMIKPAYGSGIVSSFFTFNSEQYKTNWAEIDIEFLGRHTNQVDTNIIKTINGYADKNKNVQKHTLNKRNSDEFWKVGIEWHPNYIQWSINDIVVRTSDIHIYIPQKLMMNIWIGNPSWAGEFNEGLLPQQAEYKYIRYSAYENGKFVFKWQDAFDTIDKDRWYIASHKTGDTQFVEENVKIENGSLILKLTK